MRAEVGDRISSIADPCNSYPTYLSELIKFIPIISFLRLFEEKLWSTLKMCLPPKPRTYSTTKLATKCIISLSNLLKVSIKSKSKTALVG